MKTLVVYYSRTGTTSKIGEIIAGKLGADKEEIKDTVNRSGAVGYVYAGRDAMRRNLTKLEKTILNPADYDLVVVGTPIWAWNVSTPVRTYLTEHKIDFKKIAFFCTMTGNGDINAFKEMSEVVDKQPVDVVAFTTKEVVDSAYEEKMANYISKLQKEE